MKANSSGQPPQEEWIQAKAPTPTQPTPPEDSGEPFCWILRPTLQLKIKANSSTEN